MIQKKKKEKHAACRKNTHTHEPTHTLSFKRVGCTTFPTSLDGAAEVAEPRSPAERPCAAAAAAAGCGFFFFTPRLPLVPPGVLAPWSSLHSTSPSTWRTPGHHDNNVPYNRCLSHTRANQSNNHMVMKVLLQRCRRVRLRCCRVSRLHSDGPEQKYEEVWAVYYDC